LSACENLKNPCGDNLNIISPNVTTFFDILKFIYYINNGLFRLNIKKQHLIVHEHGYANL
jgi:hypothetical protein